jgi:hypothetical protein
MEAFCILIKVIIGDFMLPIIAIVLGLSTIWPQFGKWVKNKEGHVKSSKPMRRIFGSVLIFGAILFICCDANLQLSQSKQQSPIYQHQLMLNDRIQNFSKQCKTFADDYAKDSNSLSIVNGRSELYRRMDVLEQELLASGVDTKTLRKMFEEGNHMEMTGDSWLKVAKELDRISKTLPKN